MGDLINKIEKLVKKAGKNQKPLIKKTELHELVVAICRNIRIKAPIRFLLSCAVAKIDKPDIDIRKPYTEIKSDDIGRAKFCSKSASKRSISCIATIC